MTTEHEQLFPKTFDVEDTRWFLQHWRIMGYTSRPSISNPNSIKLVVRDRYQKVAKYTRGLGDRTWARSWIDPQLRKEEDERGREEDQELQGP